MAKRFGFSWGKDSNNQGTSYTPSERKGEVNELRNQLRDPAVQKDQNKRRDTLKKVVAFMTLGIDVSPLFTEMIMACATKDIVQKKIVYLYLCAYAETNSDIAILAINTLQKDCGDDSPLVRGLALRSLSSLRLSSLCEYLVPTLKKMFGDTAPYVRKTAIIASLKLFRISPETFRTLGMTDKLYGMLRDNDVLVCTNALCVLEEVLEDEGGIKLTKNILYFLLNRMRDFNEWQQTYVLKLCLRYNVASEDEMFDIMNLLEERLRGSNSAVILSCVHVFLNLTENLPKVHMQVFQRIKDPLLTLMSTAPLETAYCVMCHIKLLIQREAKPFMSAYRDFYVRHTDPTYLKAVKIDILGTLANDSNASDIIAELVVAVNDTPNIAQLAIKTIGKVAMRVESAASTALVQFLELIEMDVEHIRSITLIVMKDYLRKYCDMDVVKPFLEAVVGNYKNMAYDDVDSKVAFAWMLGEFGEHIDDAPYLLEAMSQNFPDEPFQMRMELLSSLMKLFFKRAPEVQTTLGHVLSEAVNDFSHADVHDRALLYYRLLKADAKLASRIVTPPRRTVSAFMEDANSETRDKLFEEFNTLSVIYNLPASKFHRRMIELEEDDEEEEEDEDEEDEEGLLDAFKLAPDASLDPPAFQHGWSSFTPVATVQASWSSIPGANTIDEHLLKYNIQTLASGGVGGNFKIYLYAQELTNEAEDEDEDEDLYFFLVELVTKASGEVTAAVKSNSPNNGTKFIDILRKALGTLGKLA